MATQEALGRTKDRWLVALTLGLFALGCCMPAVDKARITDAGALQDSPLEGPFLLVGLYDLIWGWLSCHPAWLANPVLAVAVVLMWFGWRWCATAAGVLAAGLGLTTCNLFKLAELYPGYYVWEASQLVFAIGACWFCLSGRSRH
jgi:hypothetical protein